MEIYMLIALGVFSGIFGGAAVSLVILPLAKKQAVKVVRRYDAIHLPSRVKQVASDPQRLG